MWVNRAPPDQPVLLAGSEELREGELCCVVVGYLLERLGHLVGEEVHLRQGRVGVFLRLARPGGLLPLLIGLGPVGDGVLEELSLGERPEGDLGSTCFWFPTLSLAPWTGPA
jgi:hypothetical protein